MKKNRPAALVALALCAALAACADPRLVVLSFTATGAPARSGSSITAAYAWSFTAGSEPSAESALPVSARLYYRTGGTSRKLAAEADLSLTAASGSAICTFTNTGSFPSGVYYAEFAYADDAGPEVVSTMEAAL